MCYKTIKRPNYTSVLEAMVSSECEGAETTLQLLLAVEDGAYGPWLSEGPSRPSRPSL